MQEIIEGFFASVAQVTKTLVFVTTYKSAGNKNCSSFLQIEFKDDFHADY